MTLEEVEEKLNELSESFNYHILKADLAGVFRISIEPTEG